MNFGVSTGCFFPEKTLASLQNVADIGAKHTEIFFNTDSELEIEYLTKLKEIADKNQIVINSIHPFTSAIETFYFFSRYDYKLQDAIKLYEKYFKACNFLGCKYVVFHGCFSAAQYMSIDKYTNIVNILAEKAEEYGVFISQENVVNYKCGYLENLQLFDSLAGKNIKYTLDIKQTVRANQDLYSLLKVMGSKLSHVHISDYTNQSDCLLPLCGNFDFKTFFQFLQDNTTAETAIIEVYRENFKDKASIKKSLNSLLNL